MNEDSRLTQKNNRVQLTRTNVMFVMFHVMLTLICCLIRVVEHFAMQLLCNNSRNVQLNFFFHGYKVLCQHES